MRFHLQSAFWRNVHANGGLLGKPMAARHIPPFGPEINLGKREMPGKTEPR